MTAEIAAIEPIQATAHGPGEISGPALKITLDVHNGSADPIDLSLVTVNLSDSQDAPASPMTGPPAEPFTGVVAPGDSASGVYVFAIPTDRRSPISVTFNYATDAPIVVFSGPAG